MVGAAPRSGAAQPLAEDLVLVVDQRSGVVVAVPADEPLIAGGAVRHARGRGAVARVTARSHVGDAEVVGAARCPRAVEALPEDLEFVVDERGAVVVALPNDEPLVVRGAVGHGWAVGAIARVAVRPHVGDAEVVGAALCARRGEPLAKDLGLAGHERPVVVRAGPRDEPLVVRAAEGHAWQEGAVGRVAVGAHLGHAEVVGADLGAGAI